MKSRLLPALLALAIMSGCAGQVRNENKVEREVFAMDTYMTVTCYGVQAEEACDAAIAEIRRLDECLSVGSPESEVSKINANGGGTLSEDTRILINTAMTMYDETSGAFDISIYPLMSIWGFTTGNYAVPEPEEINTVLASIGTDKLQYEDESRALKLSLGQGIDFGGIAKGYTSDRLKDVFSGYTLTGAIVSLGGNVQVYGKKPDGTSWRCGIQDPVAADNGQTLMGVLTADNVAVITSGAYERFFTDDEGNIYHHILNPITGYPADSDLVSVTIVSESGIQADCLSTACYVMGMEKATELWRQSPEKFDMILMTEDSTVYITEPLKGSFKTDYPLTIIE